MFVQVFLIIFFSQNSENSPLKKNHLTKFTLQKHWIVQESLNKISEKLRNFTTETHFRLEKHNCLSFPPTFQNSSRKIPKTFFHLEKTHLNKFLSTKNSWVISNIGKKVRNLKGYHIGN